jgi:hypothetical protein
VSRLRANLDAAHRISGVANRFHLLASRVEQYANDGFGIVSGSLHGGAAELHDFGLYASLHVNAVTPMRNV